jgi:hypothetical protein
MGRLVIKLAGGGRILGFSDADSSHEMTSKCAGIVRFLAKAGLSERIVQGSTALDLDGSLMIGFVG